MKTIAIIAVVGVAALALFSLTSTVDSGIETQFQDYLSNYGRNYGTEAEYQARLAIFSENLNTIERLNIENPRATFSVNGFADRSQQEMTVKMGLRIPEGTVTTGKHIAPNSNAVKDWTYLWKEVKDQGQCGSCWAFSAAAAFEARRALNDGTNGDIDAPRSEQELVDCDTQSSGCNGGWMDFAFTYLKGHGFCTETQYPYHAKDETCQASLCADMPQDKAFTDIPAGDEKSLVNELVANGPIAVAVDASSWSFYNSGVLDSCGSSLNHGVTLVATDGDSLKIRNSWAGSWGEEGYIRLAAGKNLCGVANVASFPTF
eukprot:CAMPEP_0205818830 /NCGR_PEP_ID=MMETSP0206-20130828/894_1 /ASSEMBLY_ACC=CAM_ASM_000279 /TAXON_ID=36767 /ORGANISM="Euplotes focardii, Strain TN1" /LENGTH=316 /DNA_ID=CAMNT_0053111609 /DNA_START=43 /DNA_END=993 /DNA_ORIENTATION=-